MHTMVPTTKANAGLFLVLDSAVTQRGEASPGSPNGIEVVQQPATPISCPVALLRRHDE